MDVYRLRERPVHLGLGARAEIEPQFSGEMAWYADYSRRRETDGADGRLVSVFTFTAPWTTWEMHPEGEEVFFCLAGEIVLILETETGSDRSLRLRAGEVAINPRGVWHTADVTDEAEVLFITAGRNTQVRPR